MLTCTVNAVIEAISDPIERFLKIGLYDIERSHQPPTFCATKHSAECLDVKSTEHIVEALTLVEPVF